LIFGIVGAPEIISVMARKRRERNLTSAHYRAAKSAFLEDLADMAICEMTESVVQTAIDLLEAFPLRTLEAIHLAGAIESKADVFISADKRQLEAAAKMGLRTIRG